MRHPRVLLLCVDWKKKLTILSRILRKGIWLKKFFKLQVTNIFWTLFICQQRRWREYGNSLCGGVSGCPRHLAWDQRQRHGILSTGEHARGVRPLPEKQQLCTLLHTTVQCRQVSPIAIINFNSIPLVKPRSENSHSVLRGHIEGVNGSRAGAERT